jgi:hypothetical protein
LKISTRFIIFDVDKLSKSDGDQKIQHFNGDTEINIMQVVQIHKGMFWLKELK